MTPNCCCCCCHCYMYSVHICANSCAFNRSLLSVNFCKFTAHTSTMFINKYENKKRKRASPIDSRPIEHVRRISPKNALEKIYSQFTIHLRFEFALIIHELIDVIVHAMTRFTRVHTPTHTCMHTSNSHSLSHMQGTITIQITQRAVQNKKQLIGAVAI